MSPDWQALKAHPVAEIFPMLVSSDLETLKNDIMANGQLEPIVLTDEDKPRILDGRNRLEAWKHIAAQLDAESLPHSGPKFKTTGIVKKDATEAEKTALYRAYVVSANLERRHLSPSQRAALAVTLRPLLKNNGEPGKADVKAAAFVKVSPAQVRKTARIQRENPEGFERLRDDKATVNAEYDKLRKRETNELNKGLTHIFSTLSAFTLALEKLNIEARDLCIEDQEHERWLTQGLAFEQKLRGLLRRLQGEKS